MREEDFDLGLEGNEFSVGNGGNFGSNVILPILKSNEEGNNFLENKPSQNYTSAENELWIQADLSGGSCKFVVNFTIVQPGKSSLSSTFSSLNI